MEHHGGSVQIRNSKTGTEALFEVVGHISDYMRGGIKVCPMGTIFAHDGPLITMAHMAEGVVCRIEVPDDTPDVPDALYTAQRKRAEQLKGDGKSVAAGQLLPLSQAQPFKEENATTVQ